MHLGLLVLDYNEDRSLQTQSNKSKGNSLTSNSTINFDTAIESIQSSQAKVQINTLSQYVGFGGGIYMMYSVKKLTAQEDFLVMPLKDRNCDVELYEDCHMEICRKWNPSVCQRKELMDSISRSVDRIDGFHQ